jgi:hypothetical protein
MFGIPKNSTASDSEVAAKVEGLLNDTRSEQFPAVVTLG